MHYLSVENISKSFGIKPLFQNLSFHINEGDKIALVAKNGSGKSTLLKILSGREVPDEGKVWLHKDVDIALFEQEPLFDENKSIIDNIFGHAHPVIDAIKAYETALEEDDQQKINHALIDMEDMSAWDFDAKVKQILGKLNIHGLQQIVGHLSGGQRKRVALARTLIDIGFEHKHVLLIMDEPTNHLDVAMVEWLEHYLNQEHITLLMVTHDRYFLDAVCSEIWELDNEGLYVYKGDYENYLFRKSERIESERASIDKARNTYRKELEWMRKQPKARTTKSKSREQNFYEVEKRAKQKIEDAHLQLQLKMNRLGGKVAELKKVYKSYGEKVLLKGFDYTFKKGERLGIVGKNGAGKSTFLKLLTGQESPDSGKINIGDTIVFGNFSQEGLQYTDDVRVIEFVKNIAENFPLNNGKSLSASQFLELFLFTPEQQYTYLSKLSGGEKKRLQLLSILFRNPNFLILDEPTNDLDLATLNVLENFLDDFPGCLIIVSHDRYFMDRLVDHLFVFEGEGIIMDFPGNYAQYRDWQKQQEKELIQNKQATPAKVAHIEKVEDKPKKLSFKEQQEWKQLNTDIPQLEAEKLQITHEMSSEVTEYEQMQQMGRRLQEINNLLEEKEMRWLELSERV